jgi:hypothetical protein
MAKKTRTPGQAAAQQNKAGNGENISGYFRRIFQESPNLLKTRSNDELLRRWLADHPGETEVPKSVKVGLQNVKSVLRSKGRKRKAAKVAAVDAANPGSLPSPRPTPKKTRLERLEEQIDDVLTFARALDRQGLENVIGHLRRARNEVVWKMGQ